MYVNIKTCIEQNNSQFGFTSFCKVLQACDTSCVCGIVKVWKWKCESESVKVKVWKWKCESESVNVSSSDDSPQAGGWGKKQCDSKITSLCGTPGIPFLGSYCSLRKMCLHESRMMILRFCNILIYILLQPDLAIFCLRPTKTQNVISFLWATFPTNSGTDNINYG